MEDILVNNDEHFMRIALDEARKAYEKDDVPIGAVIVCKNTIIAKAFNLVETLNDPSAHAEMQAITSAANWLGSKYLKGCTLYVTVEPCSMCAAALGWAQIDKIVYGAPDPKKGFSIIAPKVLHPKTTVVGGICVEECSSLMRDFFKKKR